MRGVVYYSRCSEVLCRFRLHNNWLVRRHFSGNPILISKQPHTGKQFCSFASVSFIFSHSTSMNFITGGGNHREGNLNEKALELTDITKRFEVSHGMDLYVWHVAIFVGMHTI